MDYRGFIIRKCTFRGKSFYRAETTPPGRRLAEYVATDDCPIGIMRAVDDYITTGRKQYRTSA